MSEQENHHRQAGALVAIVLLAGIFGGDVSVDTFGSDLTTLVHWLGQDRRDLAVLLRPRQEADHGLLLLLPPACL